MNTQSNYAIHPPRQRWTHLALHVKDIDVTVAWYERFTHLRLLATNEDPQGRGAWLADPAQDVESPFVLVIAQFYEGKEPFPSMPLGTLAPFNHIGIEVTAREEVDRIADMARADGCLGFGPTQMPAPIGYICFVKDPDGNILEFSYDQGVYETIKREWGGDAS